MESHYLIHDDNLFLMQLLLSFLTVSSLLASFLSTDLNFSSAQLT
jgi:hypothetical protein